jgi:tRNA(Arg) A34 adenosine deaminase TadA
VLPFTIIKKLVDIAENSTMNMRLASCVLKKGCKIVGRPQCNHNEIPKHDVDLGSSHAEIATINQFMGILGLKSKCCDKFNVDTEIKKEMSKYDIAVIRIDNKDPDVLNLVNGRPCHKCLNVIKMYGFKRIHYSDDNGNIITESVKNMLSVHSSYVTIKLHFLRQNINYVNNNEYNQKYYDEIIQKQLPDTVREMNFKYFVIYDFKNISTRYRMIEKKVDGNRVITIVNINNKKIKTISII